MVDTVVSAFTDDPAFRFFFADDGDFHSQAGRFVGYLFDKRVAQRTVWVVDGGAAVAMWEPPGHPIDNDQPDPPALDLPAATMARLDAYDAEVHAALPPTSHWYLGLLATHPDRAGRGWGRAALAPGLRRAAAAGLPAYLETSHPRNVELYRRAGWDVVAVRPVQGLTVWIMRRAAGQGYEAESGL